MQVHKIHKKQARQLFLQAQGLLFPKQFGLGKEGILKALRQLSYIQIDSISVVRRAHHHTLWTRLPDYQAAVLGDLQAKERQILEYWSHAAAYLPMEDYRFCLPRMNAFASGERHWFKKDPKMMGYVLDRIKAEGALKARDFKRDDQQKSGQWWNWKPAKKALEQLFMEGKLMVSRRENFQKVYDLPERVLPSHIQTSTPTPKEYAHFLIDNAIRSFALTSLPEIVYLRKGIKKIVQTVLNELLEDKKIVAVQVEGIDHQLFYSTKQHLQNLPPTATTPKLVHLLSPFDNAIIQRKRIAQLFDFQYKIECYIPKNKRVNGYFSLPILWNTQFMGQVDAKAERKTATLHLRHLVFEKNSTSAQIANLIPFLAQKIRQFAHFNDCQHLVIERVTPVEYTNFAYELID